MTTHYRKKKANSSNTQARKPRFYASMQCSCSIKVRAKKAPF